MRPARFVTWCFVYGGGVLAASWALNYQFRVSVASLTQLGVALAILATGVQRLRRPSEEAENPAEYGLFAYAMAVLALLLTAILVARVLLL